VFREAVGRYGSEAFLRPKSGAALAADMVGGADPTLYEFSRAIGVACEARSTPESPVRTSDELGTAVGVDADLVRWALDLCDRLLGPTHRVPLVASVAPPVEEHLDPGRSELDEPLDHPLNLKPIVAVLVLAGLLVLFLVVLA
jgi:hypothetical protein